MVSNIKLEINQQIIEPPPTADFDEVFNKMLLKSIISGEAIEGGYYITTDINTKTSISSPEMHDPASEILNNKGTNIRTSEKISQEKTLEVFDNNGTFENALISDDINNNNALEKSLKAVGDDNFPRKKVEADSGKLLLEDSSSENLSEDVVSLVDSNANVRQIPSYRENQKLSEVKSSKKAPKKEKHKIELQSEHIPDIQHFDKVNDKKHESSISPPQKKDDTTEELILSSSATEMVLEQPKHLSSDQNIDNCSFVERSNMPTITAAPEEVKKTLEETVKRESADFCMSSATGTNWRQHIEYPVPVTETFTVTEKPSDNATTSIQLSDSNNVATEELDISTNQCFPSRDTSFNELVADELAVSIKSNVEEVGTSENIQKSKNSAGIKVRVNSSQENISPSETNLSNRLNNAVETNNAELRSSESLDSPLPTKGFKPKEISPRDTLKQQDDISTAQKSVNEKVLDDNIFSENPHFSEAPDESPFSNLGLIQSTKISSLPDSGKEVFKSSIISEQRSLVDKSDVQLNDQSENTESSFIKKQSIKPKSKQKSWDLHPTSDNSELKGLSSSESSVLDSFIEQKELDHKNVSKPNVPSKRHQSDELGMDVYSVDSENNDLNSLSSTNGECYSEPGLQTKQTALNTTDVSQQTPSADKLDIQSKDASPLEPVDGLRPVKKKSKKKKSKQKNEISEQINEDSKIKGECSLDKTLEISTIQIPVDENEMAGNTSSEKYQIDVDGGAISNHDVKDFATTTVSTEATSLADDLAVLKKNNELDRQNVSDSNTLNKELDMQIKQSTELGKTEVKSALDQFVNDVGTTPSTEVDYLPKSGLWGEPKASDSTSPFEHSHFVYEPDQHLKEFAPEVPDDENLTEYSSVSNRQITGEVGEAVHSVREFQSETNSALSSENGFIPNSVITAESKTFDSVDSEPQQSQDEPDVHLTNKVQESGSNKKGSSKDKNKLKLDELAPGDDSALMKSVPCQENLPVSFGQKTTDGETSSEYYPPSEKQKADDMSENESSICKNAALSTSTDISTLVETFEKSHVSVSLEGDVQLKKALQSALEVEQASFDNKSVKKDRTKQNRNDLAQMDEDRLSSVVNKNLVSKSASPAKEKAKLDEETIHSSEAKESDDVLKTKCNLDADVILKRKDPPVEVKDTLELSDEQSTVPSMDKDRLHLQMHEARSLMDSVSDSLFEKNREMMHLLNRDVEDEVLLCEQGSTPATDALTILENLLLDIQKKCVFADEKDVGTDFLVNPSKDELGLLMWLGKERHYPVQYDVLEIRESEIEGICTPTLSATNFSHFDDSQKHFYVQKIALMVHELQQLTVDTETSENVTRIIYQYVLIIECIQHWIEFLETWILRISQLPADQHLSECKLIEEQLTSLQKYFSSVTDFKPSVSNILPVDIKNGIIQKFGKLHEQLDSTKQFAATSFTQVSGWVEKSCKIEGDLKTLNAVLKSQENELEILQNERNDSVREIDSLNSSIFENCCKCESLFSNKQKFSLNWIGYQIDDDEPCLEWYKMLKIKGLRTSVNANNIRYSVENFQVSYELLKQLLHLLESIISRKPCIQNLEDSKRQKELLKNSMQSLETLLWTVKKNSEASSEAGSVTVADKEYELVVSKVSDVMQNGQEKVADWEQWECKLVELYDLIGKTSSWLQAMKMDFETFSDDDLSDSYTVLKNLQLELLDFSNDINRIKTLKKDVSSHLEVASMVKSVTEVLNLYKELHNSIDSKLNVSLFCKEWETVKSEVNDMQRCLATSNKQITRMHQKINHMGSDDSILKCLQNISEIETEMEYRSSACKWIKDNNKHEEFFIAVSDADSANLNSVCDEWDKITNSAQQLKRSALQKIYHSEKSVIHGKLKSWITNVEDSLNSILLDHTVSIAELKNIKHKLIGFLKVLGIVIDYLNETKQEADENPEADATHSLDKDEIQLLKFKLICEFEKCESLILQHKEYIILSSEVDPVLEKIDENLKGEESKIWQMDHFAVSKFKTKIEEFQKFLGQKNFQDLKKLHLEKIESSKDLLNTYKKLSVVESLLPSLLGEINEYLLLRNQYQEAERSISAFISKMKHVLFVCCESVVNAEHLSQSIATLQKMQHDFNTDEELLERLKSTGSELEKNLKGQPQIEIQTKVQCLNNEWINVNETISKLLERQLSLATKWSEFYGSYDSLSTWISCRQAEVLCSHLNRPSSLKELEVISEELNDNKSRLTSLQDLGSMIQNNPLLHSSAKDGIKSKLYSLHSSFKSLEEVLNLCLQRLQDISEETDADKQILQSAEIFLDGFEKNFRFNVPHSKQDIEDAFTITELSLVEAASHFSDVECIRRRLLFDEKIDFAVATHVSKILICLQRTTSKLTVFYLELTKVYSQSNSIPENIICILKFLKTFRNMFAEIPSEYSELLKFLMNAQLMDVYIYGHRSILHCIIQEGLRRCKVEDPSNVGCFVECFEGVQHEWDCLDNIYETKINEIKRAICTWETYFHCINDVKIWIHKAKKVLKSHPRVLKPSEIKNEISVLQTLISEQEMFSSMMEKAKKIAHVLGATVNSVARDNLLSEISSLQEISHQQADSLKSILKELNDMLISSEKLDSDLLAVKERVVSVCSFVGHNIPTDFKNLKNRQEEIQAELEKIKRITLSLDGSECQIGRMGEKMLCHTYSIQASMQREILKSLRTLLEQHAANLSDAINYKQNFEQMHKVLLKWNELTEAKIRRQYHEPPEDILDKIQTSITSEVLENQNLLKQVTVMGQSFMDCEEKVEKISNAVSSCSANMSRTSTLVDTRNESIGRILVQKERVVLLREKIEEFLTRAEKYLQIPVQLSEVSLKNIDGLIQAIQVLQNDIQLQNEPIETLTKDTNDLMAESDAFRSGNEKYLFQLSTQMVLSRWNCIKALTLQRCCHLVNVKDLWTEILKLLSDLEDWLDSKEKIESQVDYTTCDHPRTVYLEGIKVFETLKHNFQDDVHLLHNANAAYHKTSRKNLDVKNCLQNRVLALNDRWHNLFQKVSDTITAINEILQLWADYEQLHQHLHLFLTETHLKITELEHVGTLNQNECDSIMNDFAHHHDALQRFYSMAKNLQQRSRCSAEEIDIQVEEIRKYWAEVYECLQCYRESVSKKTEAAKSEDFHQQSAELSNVDDEQSRKVLTHSGIVCQTVDDDGMTSTADEFETDSVVGTSNKDSDEMITTTESRKRIIEEDLCRGQKALLARSSGETDDDRAEFIKDLLAALKEAEDRIETLEVVLSEPTPCGTEDDIGPNYSRLLAACRSSIDVIQHLSQLLPETPSGESSEPNEAAIQHRTEGMLNRWEKIETAALNKEYRALENARKWQQFSRELQDIEKWLLDTLEAQTSQSIADVDVEKFILTLQKHEALISEITAQKKTILALNLTGQNFIVSSAAKSDLAAVDEKLKSVNDHWDKLCSAAFEWQNRLQTEFLQSSEFRTTISEMELWLEDSKERIQCVDLSDECTTTLLHEQHTEIFALKQQLENCSQRVKTLLDISGYLFHNKDELSSGEILDVQSRLDSILHLSQSLLLECTEILASLSALLTSRMTPQGEPSRLSNSNSNVEEEEPTRIGRCCNFLLRVARASFPIQAVLLLLLGAAILLPKEEEELSCRFSNNFASSLNPMLRFPDGPPPV